MWILGEIASSVVKTITDTFTRVTTAGFLGVSTSGTTWNVRRGNWYANGNAAEVDDSAGTYPVATVSFGTNGTFSADVTGGMGLTYWLSDSGSWWASTTSYTSSPTSSFQCGTGTAGCVGSGCQPSGCCSGVSYSTVTGGSSGSGSCSNGTNYGFGSALSCSQLSGSYFCSPYSGTSFSCTDNGPRTAGTCATGSYVSGTSYSSNVNVLNSVANTVTTVSTTSVGTSSSGYIPIASLQVKTSGTTVTTRAYSDHLTTQMGADIVTAGSSGSNAGVGSNVGIIKAPTTDSQGSTIDNYSANV